MGLKSKEKNSIQEMKIFAFVCRENYEELWSSEMKEKVGKLQLFEIQTKNNRGNMKL